MKIHFSVIAMLATMPCSGVSSMPQGPQCKLLMNKDRDQSYAEKTSKFAKNTYIP
jgi:hypothetical protein